MNLITSARIAARAMPKRHSLLITALCLIVLLDSLAYSQTVANESLVFTRLKHDKYYLQVYQRYTPKFPYEEKAIKLNLNDSRHEITYYENKDVDPKSIAQDDLILEALDRTYKSRLFPAYIYDYDRLEDKRQSGDPSLVKPAICERELALVASELRIDDTNSLRFFDSFGKDEIGLLYGNYHWVGNWRECSKRHTIPILTNKITMNFTGRYCFASIVSPDWSWKIEDKIKELKAKRYFKYPEQESEYRRFFRIQVGFCLPQSCDSNTFDTRKDLLENYVMKSLEQPYRSSFKLNNVYCLPDEQSPMRRITWSGSILLTFIICWLFLVMVLTLYDIFRTIKLKRRNRTRPAEERENIKSELPERKSELLEKLVTSMSLYRNCIKFFETKSLWRNYKRMKQCNEPQIKLNAGDTIFINSFKVISVLFIIFGHNGMLLQHLNRFPLDYDSYDTTLAFHVISGAVFFVDWFFAITGFLLTYSMFTSKLIDKCNLTYWIYTVFHRYWRLAPIFLLIFWFSKTLFEHLSYGPLWDYGTSGMTIRGICHDEGWFYPITLLTNFNPLHKECIMPSWYLSSDFQFYLITPFLLVLLSKSPLYGWLTTLSLIFACISLRFFRYMTDPKVRPLELLRIRIDLWMRNNWDVHPTYLQPQYRVASYLIGILAAHYVFMVLTGKWKSILYRKDYEEYRAVSGQQQGVEIEMTADKNGATVSPAATTRGSVGAQRANRNYILELIHITGWLTVTGMLLASWVLDTVLTRSLEPYAKYITAFIYATCHSIVASGLMLILSSMMLGAFPMAKTFLSHPWWSIVSKLNYVTFLIQVEVIYWMLQSADYLVEVNSEVLMALYFKMASVTFLVAFVMTLLLEFPFAQLEHKFIGWRFTKAPNKKE